MSGNIFFDKANARPKPKHVVNRVTFIPKTNDGPLECACGDSMLASQFAAHRNGFGLGQDATHRALPQEAERATPWKHGRVA